MRPLEVILIKPSKYNPDGFVQRFWKGFMPNATGRHIMSMTPAEASGAPVRVSWVDEYVYRPEEFMHLLSGSSDHRTLVALVGVQSHQFQRALDLAAFAVAHGCLAIIGGPHPMTCDTKDLQGRGVSFALAEAEQVWPTVIGDAAKGELQDVYGEGQRWAKELNASVLVPPTKGELKRYAMPMIGVYPARGCPFLCNFCSVIKIAGRQVRSQPVDTTIQTLRAAKNAGVRIVMFTSDNMNKYPGARELMEAMIEARTGLRFFCQCDTQIAGREDLIALMARAGCFQMFVGAESFDRETLIAAHKAQNRPETYRRIVDACRRHGIKSHFSSIIGFPNQDRADIREHVNRLLALDPDAASFYVLTPFPGAEQYGDFRRQGLLVEPNLDRYDTTHLVWRHPRLPPDELRRLLFECYCRFYRLDRAFGKAVRRYGMRPGRVMSSMETAVFNWMSGVLGRHPMSGGIGIRKIDHVREYLPYRRKLFGDVLAGDCVPLPDNLELSVSDEETNRKASPLPAG